MCKPASYIIAEIIFWIFCWVYFSEISQTFSKVLCIKVKKVLPELLKYIFFIASVI